MTQIFTAAGELDQRVTWQRAAAPTPDGHGHDATQWDTPTVLATTWAKIQTSGGREFARVREIVADMTHLVEIHFDDRLANLTPRDRCKWGSRILEIKSVMNPMQSDRRMLIACTEKI